MQKMFYVIQNSVGKRLSSYYPNALRKDQLVYRENSYITYNTMKEARSHLAYIQRGGLGRNLKIKLQVNK
jgi:hypothetical protein